MQYRDLAKRLREMARKCTLPKSAARITRSCPTIWEAGRWHGPQRRIHRHKIPPVAPL